MHAEDERSLGVKAKAQLRVHVRALRRAITAEQRERDAALLAERLVGLPEISQAKLVLAYGANAEEVDPEPALRRLRAAGVRVAYPRVAGDTLDLHEVDHYSDLVPGSFGINEPRAEAPRVDASSIEAVLVPAVAFDKEGYRVGYGGGFYDRFLDRLPPDTPRIGIAFDEQIVDAVPHEPHDRRVQVVVTPTAVYHGGAS